MYDVEHQDEAIKQLNEARAKIHLLNKKLVAERTREHLRNKRCALDVAGRVLNYNLGGSDTIEMKADEVAAQVILLASRLVPWLNEDDDTQDEEVGK